MVSQIDSPQVEQGFSCVPAESRLGFFAMLRSILWFSAVERGVLSCHVFPIKLGILRYLDSWGKVVASHPSGGSLPSRLILPDRAGEWRGGGLFGGEPFPGSEQNRRGSRRK